MGPWICVLPKLWTSAGGRGMRQTDYLDSGIPREDPKDPPPVGSRPLWTGLPPPHQLSLRSSHPHSSAPYPHHPTKCLPKGVCLVPGETQPSQGFPATPTSSLSTLLRAPSSPALPPPTWAKWGREPGNKLFSHPLLAWETYHHLPTPHNSHAHPHPHAKP